MYYSKLVYFHTKSKTTTSISKTILIINQNATFTLLMNETKGNTPKESLIFKSLGVGGINSASVPFISTPSAVNVTMAYNALS